MNANRARRLLLLALVGVGTACGCRAIRQSSQVPRDQWPEYKSLNDQEREIRQSRYDVDRQRAPSAGAPACDPR